MSDHAVIQLRGRRRKVVETTWLTTEEVMARLKVSERTIRRWVAAGKIPHVRLGDDERILRFPSDLIDEMMQKRLAGTL